jgi:hypothetical protein
MNLSPPVEVSLFTTADLNANILEVMPCISINCVKGKGLQFMKNELLPLPDAFGSLSIPYNCRFHSNDKR